MEDIKKKNESLKEYYGSVIKTQKDLKTNICCITASVPKHLQKIVDEIDSEILNKFYGCGSPIPYALEGCTVLDLGCGAGRDAYIVSKLVGEEGRVIGVDMTEEQIEVARKHKDSQTKWFGFSSPNVEFRKGYIENLKEIGIQDNSIDVVISNCVINLSPDKRKVFSEAFRVLKPGGELCFSDIFASRRIPVHLNSDPVLRGECIAGALYTEDFRRLMRGVGCLDFRRCANKELALGNPEIIEKLGTIKLYSQTIRAFKLSSLEDTCEDYGQVAIYLGTMPNSPDVFMLDESHVFETGKPTLVCGNTASMIQETRFSKYFKVIGDRSKHYGLFNCGPKTGITEEDATSFQGGVCC